MNNNFNFGRFGKYFVYDLKRQWKNIGMLVLTFALSLSFSTCSTCSSRRCSTEA